MNSWKLKLSSNCCRDRSFFCDSFIHNRQLALLCSEQIDTFKESKSLSLKPFICHIWWKADKQLKWTVYSYLQNLWAKCKRLWNSSELSCLLFLSDETLKRKHSRSSELWTFLRTWHGNLSLDEDRISSSFSPFQHWHKSIFAFYGKAIVEHHKT